MTTATRPAAQRPGRARTRTTTAHNATGQPTAAAPATLAEADRGGTTTNGSEQRVRTALANGTDLTVAALAEATSLGRSTVSKALTRLEAAGHAVRTTSGGAGRARQPDRWNPTLTGTTAPPTVPQAQPSGGSPEAERNSQPEPDVELEPCAGLEPDAGPEPDAESDPEASVAPTDGAADGATDAEQPAAGRRTAGSRGSRVGRLSTEDTPAVPSPPAVASAADGGEERRNPKTGTARLAPGELTQLVADHFGRHPGTPLTSGEVGRALGRSGGAVRNAADKLTGDGVLRLLDGTPRRYTTAE